jgi:hypothetical protein
MDRHLKRPLISIDAEAIGNLLPPDEQADRTKAASQAEYAGSIPVIGSTLTSGNAVRNRSIRPLSITGVSQLD